MFKLIKSLFKGFIELKETAEEISEQVTGSRKVDHKTIQMIQEFEGFKATAYKDVAGIWTIGYGSTYYQDGTKVKRGDKITKQDAEQLLTHVVQKFADDVNEVVTAQLNDCQFGAVVSLVYNIGINAFKRSTILKKINADPDDPSIHKEFKRWVRAGGMTVNGLAIRRQKESAHYFSKDC